MRDHYEGTPFDMTSDISCGEYESPYRTTPLTWEYNGKQYFNERPIATQQTGFTLVAQLRSYLPDAIGGIEWFGNDDANMVAYTPYIVVPRMFQHAMLKEQRQTPHSRGNRLLGMQLGFQYGIPTLQSDVPQSGIQKETNWKQVTLHYKRLLNRKLWNCGTLTNRPQKNT